MMGIDNNRQEIKNKLRQYYDGRIVRKDLTKGIKSGANVPIYVLEFLLGQYCSSDDEAIIAEGAETVKRILSENFVRPDEAQKVLALLRERGSYTVIDRLTVHLNIKEDRYEAEFSNLGLKGIPINSDYPSQYDRLLCGGIWCILQLDYEYIEEDKKASPIHIRKLTPIQMPYIDMEELKAGRSHFSKEEWIDILIRSTGMEPDRFTEREKWLLLARMIPLIENNFNLCELGPRSTGKSHLYKEISPNSILVSGGQTTVANLFYNMSNKSMGLVGLWDCVAFDEVAGITFKDKDGIQIMKDYMASGSFARGKDEKVGRASMVFVGNINQSVSALLRHSNLFAPFPTAMSTDTAFLDRMHCYIPGWEIPKYRPDFFTDDYGFISDYLAEFMKEMRKVSFGDAIDKYFSLGSNLNQRDSIAVRKLVSGFTKLLYPDGLYSKDDIEEVLRYSLELRRRVKEQLKRIGGVEFYDVNFSYIDKETYNEHYVNVMEKDQSTVIRETSQREMGIVNDINEDCEFSITAIQNAFDCKEIKAERIPAVFPKLGSEIIDENILPIISGDDLRFLLKEKEILHYMENATAYIKSEGESIRVLRGNLYVSNQRVSFVSCNSVDEITWQNVVKYVIHNHEKYPDIIEIQGRRRKLYLQLPNAVQTCNLFNIIRDSINKNDSEEATESQRLEMKYFEKETLNAYAFSLKIMSQYDLPEEMKISLNEMIDSLDRLDTALRKNPTYEEQTHRFFTYYVPETMRLIDSYLEYDNVEVADNRLNPVYDEVMNSINQVTKASTQRTEEIYLMATMSTMAKAEALQKIMNQDGYGEGDEPWKN
ncbi:MAG: protease Lon-related BREX system protein BrxL [Clostridiales bacterium]|nr:protease Lon-related BREX system protein BrxL [Clostridiales bacterium]